VREGGDRRSVCTSRPNVKHAHRKDTNGPGVEGVDAVTVLAAVIDQTSPGEANHVCLPYAQQFPVRRAKAEEDTMEGESRG
jgi:hypothetical protein